MGSVIHPLFLVLKLNYDFHVDVEIHHLESRKELTFSGLKVVANGPLRAAVEAEVKYGKSTIKVTVCHCPLGR